MGHVEGELRELRFVRAARYAKDTANPKVYVMISMPLVLSFIFKKMSRIERYMMLTIFALNEQDSSRRSKLICSTITF